MVYWIQGKSYFRRLGAYRAPAASRQSGYYVGTSRASRTLPFEQTSANLTRRTSWIKKNEYQLQLIIADSKQLPQQIQMSSSSVGSNFLSSVILAPFVLIMSAVSLSTLQRGLDWVTRVATTPQRYLYCVLDNAYTSLILYNSHFYSTQFFFRSMQLSCLFTVAL